MHRFPTLAEKLAAEFPVDLETAQAAVAGAKGEEPIARMALTLHTRGCLIHLEGGVQHAGELLLSMLNLEQIRLIHGDRPQDEPPPRGIFG